MNHRETVSLSQGPELVNDSSRERPQNSSHPTLQTSILGFLTHKENSNTNKHPEGTVPAWARCSADVYVGTLVGLVGVPSRSLCDSVLINGHFWCVSQLTLVSDIGQMSLTLKVWVSLKKILSATHFFSLSNSCTNYLLTCLSLLWPKSKVFGLYLSKASWVWPKFRMEKRKKQGQGKFLQVKYLIWNGSGEGGGGAGCRWATYTSAVMSASGVQNFNMKWSLHCEIRRDYFHGLDCLLSTCFSVNVCSRSRIYA